jgi:hypothetical protein
MRTLIVSLITLAALGLAQRAEALRQVRVYEVNVSSQTDAAVQAQSGLRQVLVRATGARDAANDPALAGLLAQAQQYVIATRPAGTGTGTTLVFDAAALERDITAAGRAIWPDPPPVRSRLDARSRARSIRPAIAAASQSALHDPKP